MADSFAFTATNTTPLRAANLPSLVSELSHPSASNRLASCHVFASLTASAADGEAARPLKSAALPALHGLARDDPDANVRAAAAAAVSSDPIRRSGGCITLEPPFAPLPCPFEYMLVLDDPAAAA